uniref:tumor necrosis factor receptor superfamily member 13B n=1 Tax=Myxine glutinosa TaxID=7769 RepID=UPI00358F5A6A
MTRRRCRKRCAEDLRACREQTGFVDRSSDSEVLPQNDSGRHLALGLGSPRARRRCSRLCAKDLRACKRLRRKQRKQQLLSSESSSVSSTRNSMCKEGVNSDTYWDVLLRHCVSCKSVCGQHPRQCDVHCGQGSNNLLEEPQLHRQVRSIMEVRGEKAIAQPSPGGFSTVMLAGPLLAVLLLSIFCGLATLAFRRRKRSRGSQSVRMSVNTSRNLAESHLNSRAMNSDDLPFQLYLVPGMCKAADGRTHSAPDAVQLSSTFKPCSLVGLDMSLEDCGREIISQNMPVKQHESITSRDSPTEFCLIEKGQGSGD